jgi:osmotically-inducible protein OsmY
MEEDFAMNLAASDIATRVQNALDDDPRTADAEVNASELGGTVTLTGAVRTWDIREAAEQIARSQSGVVQVINDLNVRGGRGGPDTVPPVPPPPSGRTG